MIWAVSTSECHENGHSSRLLCVKSVLVAVIQVLIYVLNTHAMIHKTELHATPPERRCWKACARTHPLLTPTHTHAHNHTTWITNRTVVVTGARGMLTRRWRVFVRRALWRSDVHVLPTSLHREHPPPFEKHAVRKTIQVK